ncbi:MAG: type II toxin-antitoxin system PemK/MazF family toxin [Acidobacteriota bacterium]
MAWLKTKNTKARLWRSPQSSRLPITSPYGGLLNRGAVYSARLDPAEGSEQSGKRPVIVISRNAINRSSPVVVVVPCTTYRSHRKIYPSQTLIKAPDGGLRADSIALGEQVRSIAKTRLGKKWGTLSAAALKEVERALLTTLDLPGQGSF